MGGQAATGFGAYQATQGGAQAGTGAFPSQYPTVPYPGVTSAQLNVQVPGSASAGFTYVAGSAGAAEFDAQNNPPATPTQTVQQMMDNLVSAMGQDPEIVPQLQDKLILGGFLNPTSRQYVPGTMNPGDATWAAYRDLLIESAGAKQPYMDYLNGRIQQGVGDKKFNLSTTSDVTKVSTPQDARAILTSVMEQELGRKPTNAEIAQYAGNLAASQQANPTHTYVNYDLSAALNAGSGGVMTGALGYGIRSLPKTEITSGGISDQGAAVEAENQIMQNNGKELAGVKGDEVYQLFLDMLKGAGSNG